ncbi:aminoglycoside phosphotransferase family protein [Flocculibacter collagenilyticus]|uniref:aminoglycoside phosphotransferase family protein n=1 Tax=Flocculibacter collagenilyticus TaxID=2744479 RepID=UPI00389907F7
MSTQIVQPTDSRRAQLRDWLSTVFETESISLIPVSGDASFRRYFRFTHNGSSLIAVDAPPTHENSEAFVAISKVYLKQGVRVPALIEYDLKQGFMCLEDFGDNLLLPQLTNDNVMQLYTNALAILPDIQQVQTTGLGDLPMYDSELLLREMHLFTDWLLPHHLNMDLTEAQRNVIYHAFHLLKENALNQPQVGVHRDYHSRNLMMLENNELGVIDYQDAVVGPITYDAVSLLRDCYIVWPDETVEQLLSHFRHLLIEQNQLTADISEATFQRWFDLMGMQRHLKASGIFARLNYRDHKASYLNDIPRTVTYIIDVAKKYPAFDQFTAFLEQDILPKLNTIKLNEKSA